MKFISFLATALSLVALTTLAFADENHEIIEKVMKEGLKGKESPLTKVLDGDSSAEKNEELAKLVKTLDGTKAPVGDQDAYDKKVAELIAAMDEIAGGKTGPDAIARLDEASNCKACHGDHKPKKK